MALFGDDKPQLPRVRAAIRVELHSNEWGGTLTSHNVAEFDTLNLGEYIGTELVLALRQGENARIELLRYELNDIFIDGRGGVHTLSDVEGKSPEELGMAYEQTQQLTAWFKGLSGPPQPRAEGSGDTEFRDLAAEHQRASALWQAVAFLAYLGSGGLGFGLFYALDLGDSTGEIIGFTAAKAAASAALVGIGIYSARLAAFHRTLSDDNRGIAEVLRVKQLDGLTSQELNAEIQKTVALFRASRDNVQVDLPALEVGRIFVPAGPKDSAD